jgi:hypothetical protein
MVTEDVMSGWSEVTRDPESEQSVHESFDADDAAISASYSLLDADLAISERAPPIDHPLHTGRLLLA